MSYEEIIIHEEEELYPSTLCRHKIKTTFSKISVCIIEKGSEVGAHIFEQY